MHVHVGVPGVTFDRVVFRDNNAASFGGGLHAAAPVTVTHSSFLSNTAGGGAGLDAIIAVVHITDTDFIANTAETDGGGAVIYEGSVSDSYFERNRAATGEGGALYLIDGTVANTELVSNTAYYGGGLAVFGTAALTDLTLQGNEAVYLGGGALIQGNAVITAVTAVNNRAGDGGGFFFGNNSRQAYITGSVLSGNAATTTAGTSGVVLGYVRAATQTLDGLVNTVVTGPGTPNSRGVQAGLGSAPALTGTTINTHTIGVVALGTASPISMPFNLIEPWPTECEPVITYTRPITVWYGSLFAAGVPRLEMASATGPISEGILGALQLSGRPDLLVRALYPWVHPKLTNIEAVVAQFPSFDAEANLRTALAAAWRPAPDTGVVFDAPVAQGTDNYLFDFFHFAERLRQRDCECRVSFCAARDVFRIERPRGAAVVFAARPAVRRR